MMTNAMSCETFDERLADYLEGDLAPADRRRVDAHLASCVRCTALVRDLEHIRAEAGALPVLAPATDLWAGIAVRIEAPVIAFGTPAAPNVAARRRWSERARLGAIAAALVAVTAGVTYTLTMSRVGAPRGANTAVVTEPPSAVPAGSATSPAGDPVRPDDVAPPASGAQVATVDSSEDRVGYATDRTTPQPTTQRVRNVPAAETYSREIDRLRTIFARNRYQLDPRTAAIIEANLKVIDEAIAQSRAALAQDPANQFLDERLNSALDKKLELLRTAALLPNRTT